MTMTSTTYISIRPCLEAENFGYSNGVAYPFKCTGRRPEEFYLWRQKLQKRSCIGVHSSLPPK